MSLTSRKLRSRLGLNVTEWAGILNIGLSTAYRWEGIAEPNIDPFQRSLLLVLNELAVEHNPKALGQFIQIALAQKGSLYALYKVLDLVYKDKNEGTC
jgi:hypothetical protein